MSLERAFFIEVKLISAVLIPKNFGSGSYDGMQFFSTQVLRKNGVYSG